MIGIFTRITYCHCHHHFHPSSLSILIGILIGRHHYFQPGLLDYPPWHRTLISNLFKVLIKSACVHNQRGSLRLVFKH